MGTVVVGVHAVVVVEWRGGREVALIIVVVDGGEP